MSVPLMCRVLKLDISSTEKLVLMAMADHAHKDGTGCYASVDTLAKETSLKRRAVQRTIDKLEERGLVTPIGKVRRGRRVATSEFGRGVTMEYKITLEVKGCTTDTLSPNEKGVFDDTKRVSLKPEKGCPKSPRKGVLRTPESKTLNQVQNQQLKTALSHNNNHHHQSSHNTPTGKPDDDDERARTAFPKQVTSESPEARIRRFKESAASKIKSKYGHLFSETEIRESLDDFESKSGSPPNSDNFFLTCFENEISDLEFKSFAKKDREQSLAGSFRNLGIDRVLFEDYCKVCEAVGHPIKIANGDEFRVVDELKKLRNAGESPSAVLEQAIITSSYTLHPVKKKSHDDLLKDTTNFGKLLWGGRCIVVCIGGTSREILSANTAQAMTGCSAEHMAEHLRATGFWAEVYRPREKTGEK